MSFYPAYKKPSLYKVPISITATNGVNMSTEQIKSGLRLSEAIKYCEENRDAEISKQTVYGDTGFMPPNNLICDVDATYSVKLPPPKSVTVTRADLVDVFEQFDIRLSEKYFDQLCKELGL